MGDLVQGRAQPVGFPGGGEADGAVYLRRRGEVGRIENAELGGADNPVVGPLGLSQGIARGEVGDGGEVRRRTRGVAQVVGDAVIGKRPFRGDAFRHRLFRGQGIATDLAPTDADVHCDVVGDHPVQELRCLEDLREEGGWSRRGAGVEQQIDMEVRPRRRRQPCLTG